MAAEVVQGLKLDAAQRRLGPNAKPRSVYVLAAVLAGHRAVAEIVRATGYSERSVFRELAVWKAARRAGRDGGRQ